MRVAGSKVKTRAGLVIRAVGISFNFNRDRVQGISFLQLSGTGGRKA